MFRCRKCTSCRWLLENHPDLTWTRLPTPSYRSASLTLRSGLGMKQAPKELLAWNLPAANVRTGCMTDN